MKPVINQAEPKELEGKMEGIYLDASCSDFSNSTLSYLVGNYRHERHSHKSRDCITDKAENKCIRCVFDKYAIGISAGKKEFYIFDIAVEAGNHHSRRDKHGNRGPNDSFILKKIIEFRGLDYVSGIKEREKDYNSRKAQKIADIVIITRNAGEDNRKSKDIGRLHLFNQNDNHTEGKEAEGIPRNARCLEEREAGISARRRAFGKEIEYLYE